MNNDLTLKFKSETGTSGMFVDITTDDGQDFSVPSDEYLEWLEDLALKQIKSKKDSSESPALKAKLLKIENEFDDLYYLINDLGVDCDLIDIGVIKDKAYSLQSMF